MIGTFNFLASILYTQIFAMIDENAKKCGGSLATPLEIYMDEWSQLRRDSTIYRGTGLFKRLKCPE